MVPATPQMNMLIKKGHINLDTCVTAVDPTRPNTLYLKNPAKKSEPYQHIDLGSIKNKSIPSAQTILTKKTEPLIQLFINLGFKVNEIRYHFNLNNSKNHPLGIPMVFQNKLDSIANTSTFTTENIQKSPWSTLSLYTSYETSTQRCSRNQLEHLILYYLLTGEKIPRYSEEEARKINLKQGKSWYTNSDGVFKQINSNIQRLPLEKLQKLLAAYSDSTVERLAPSFKKLLINAIEKIQQKAEQTLPQQTEILSTQHTTSSIKSEFSFAEICEKLELQAVVSESAIEIKTTKWQEQLDILRKINEILNSHEKIFTIDQQSQSLKSKKNVQKAQLEVTQHRKILKRLTSLINSSKNNNSQNANQQSNLTTKGRDLPALMELLTRFKTTINLLTGIGLAPAGSWVLIAEQLTVDYTKMFRSVIGKYQFETDNTNIIVFDAHFIEKEILGRLRKFLPQQRDKIQLKEHKFSIDLYELETLEPHRINDLDNLTNNILQKMLTHCAVDANSGEQKTLANPAPSYTTQQIFQKLLKTEQELSFATMEHSSIYLNDMSIHFKVNTETCPFTTVYGHQIKTEELLKLIAAQMTTLDKRFSFKKTEHVLVISKEFIDDLMQDRNKATEDFAANLLDAVQKLAPIKEHTLASFLQDLLGVDKELPFLKNDVTSQIVNYSFTINAKAYPSLNIKGSTALNTIAFKQYLITCLKMFSISSAFDYRAANDKFVILKSYIKIFMEQPPKNYIAFKKAIRQKIDELSNLNEATLASTRGMFSLPLQEDTNTAEVFCELDLDQLLAKIKGYAFNIINNHSLVLKTEKSSDLHGNVVAATYYNICRIFLCLSALSKKISDPNLKPFEHYVQKDNTIKWLRLFENPPAPEHYNALIKEMYDKFLGKLIHIKSIADLTQLLAKDSLYTTAFYQDHMQTWKISSSSPNVNECLEQIALMTSLLRSAFEPVADAQNLSNTKPILLQTGIIFLALIGEYCRIVKDNSKIEELDKLQLDRAIVNHLIQHSKTVFSTIVKKEYNLNEIFELCRHGRINKKKSEVSATDLLTSSAQKTKSAPSSVPNAWNTGSGSTAIIPQRFLNSQNLADVLSKAVSDWEAKNSHATNNYLEPDLITKIKNMTRVEQLQQDLRKVATQHGFTCRPIPGDGNCFFSAVLDQVRLKDPTTKLSQSALRQQAIQYITQNQGHYIDFTVDFEKFIKQMSKSGTWADQILAHATAQVLKMNLIILKSDNSQPLAFKVPNATNTIYLGNQVEWHFESLIIQDATKVKALEAQFNAMNSQNQMLPSTL